MILRIFKMRRNKQLGFTFLELLVVVAILAVLAAMAFPSYRNFIETQKVRSALNQWQNSFYFAQREAMRLKSPVTFCASSNGLSCAAAANDFSQGWIVRNNVGGLLEDTHPPSPEIKLVINNNQFSTNGIQFMSNGRIKNYAKATLKVYIEYPGKKLTDAEIDANSRTRKLTIDAGGRLRGIER